MPRLSAEDLAMLESIPRVRVSHHPSRNCVRITPDKGFSVASFTLKAARRGVEVVIVNDDGEEMWRMTLAAPAEGEHVVVRKVADSTEVHYVRE